MRSSAPDKLLLLNFTKNTCIELFSLEILTKRIFWRNFWLEKFVRSAGTHHATSNLFLRDLRSSSGPLGGCQSHFLIWDPETWFFGDFLVDKWFFQYCPQMPWESLKAVYMWYFVQNRPTSGARMTSGHQDIPIKVYIFWKLLICAIHLRTHWFD